VETAAPLERKTLLQRGNVTHYAGPSCLLYTLLSPLANRVLEAVHFEILFYNTLNFRERVGAGLVQRELPLAAIISQPAEWPEPVS